MVLWRTYTTQFTMTHRIADRPELVEKSCTDLHTHHGVKLVVKVHSDEWLDFKSIKAAVERVLVNLVDKELETDTETLISDLRTLISRQLCISDDDLRLSIQETEKYGVEID